MSYAKSVMIVSVALVLFSHRIAQSTEYAVGVVFHDTNRNGVRDPGEDASPNVAVAKKSHCQRAAFSKAESVCFFGVMVAKNMATVDRASGP